MRQTLIALGTVVLLAGCQDGSADIKATGNQPLEQQFQSELEALHEKYKFPGATAAYVLPDGTVGVAAVGLADVEAKTPMARDSRMLAASIGKTFVGAEALALSGEHKLNLDDPVQKWLGDRSWYSRVPNHSSMTVRQLLTHTAGLPDHVYMKEFAEAWSKKWREPGNPFPPEALVGFLLDKKPLFAPGTDWAYTDTGYILAGLVLERAAGHSFYEEVDRRFLVPLKLRDTTPSDHPDLPRLAAGYTSVDNPFGMPAKTTVAPGVLAWNPAIEWTGGGFVSDPRDLVVWAKTLYEGRAMPGNYLDDLFKSAPVTGFAGKLITGGIRYGLGVGIYEKTPFGPSYGHGGGIPGYTSSLRYYPDHKFAVAFQVNTDVKAHDYAGDMEKGLAQVVAQSLNK